MMAPMGIPRVSILLCAWASLLAVQIGGFHAHVDPDGNVGDLRGTHLHARGLHVHGEHTHFDATAPASHEHAGDQDPAGSNDISVAEMSPGKWKFPDFQFDVRQGPWIAALSADHEVPTSAAPRPVALTRHWRPPLRAPPPPIA